MSLYARLRSDPYSLAAAGYFIYGVVYLAAAYALLTPERTRDFASLPWWAFFAGGTALLLLLPYLILKRWKWFSLVLAFGPLGKAIQLLVFEWSGDGRPRLLNLLFAVVALIASALLFRAGLTSNKGQRPLA